MSTEPSSTDGVAVSFDRRMLEALVCPRTQTVLEYDASAQELISRAANLAFPIRNGIPVMLEDEARVLD
ncbi:Trm112 family protein [Phaeobacter inhibens]|uniref:Trm112 family protein n=1 Tax=Phaeobacter inhibens TaxID=221822 RepID=UPI00042705CD|nr:Trm112 family protein [Phaeobacter inhibens]AUQ67957.1 hypothetical protein PhaeoP78_03132 [Phaeobacter inhibens]UWR64360.1 Trm112 family protein [Phaeobacter inhibens]UWR99967.1 Trm112 family protein [Phaeobacter inhibens]